MDKKLTDNDIKKALDSYKKDIGCAKCGFEDKYLLTILENALAYINRLEAENERLNKLNLKQKRCEFCKHKEKHPYEEPCDMCKGYDLYEPSIAEKEIKAEAYKECIEEIKSFYKETRFAYEADNLIEEIEDFLSLREKLNYVG